MARHFFAFSALPTDTPELLKHESTAEEDVPVSYIAPVSMAVPAENDEEELFSAG